MESYIVLNNKRDKLIATRKNNKMKEYLGKLEDIMPTLENNSVQMIFADFPYNTTNVSWDKNVIDLNVFWKEANRILKRDGVVVCTAQFPFTATLAMSNLKNLRYDWVWQKTSPTGHLNANKMPMKAHENILVFYNNLPKYRPQKTIGHKRKVSKAKNRDVCIERRNNTDNIYNNEYVGKVQDYDSTERYPISVQVFSSDKQKIALHKTQKPEALLEYFIKTYTDEGDTVLDPCRGSNTTGVVCDRLNRKYIGIENDETIFEIGLARRELSLIKTAK